MDYIYILLTITFTVYGQLILKWRMNHKGAMPEAFVEKIHYFGNVFLDLWVISGFAAAFIASLAWMATLTKFELSYAYPFMSMSFVLVFFASVFLFNDAVTWQKVTGLILIISGLIVMTH